jgi:hypothetical protein
MNDQWVQFIQEATDRADMHARIQRWLHVVVR